MKNLFNNKPLMMSVTVLFTFAMIVLAIIGTYRIHSSIFVWDMWGGLDAFIKIKEGNYSTWWAQHNEHRMLLGRLLFYVYFTLFKGQGPFLIIINYLLIVLAVFLLWQILLKLTSTKKVSVYETLMGLLLVAWLFFWIQKENLIMDFQGVFFLAQLLPLCAIFYLYKSLEQPLNHRYFILSCIFGVSAVGTLANGLMVLPLLTIYALITRQRDIRIIILSALSISMIYFYLHGYTKPPHYGGFNIALKEIIPLIRYTLLYLGNPFQFALGYYQVMFMGLTLVIGSIFLVINREHHRSPPALTLALGFYIFYIEISAVITAYGRILFGEAQALSSRYTTPTIMAWAVLFVLYSPNILASLKTKPWKSWILLSLLVVIMLPQQLTALKHENESLLNQKMAAFALALEINDTEQIKKIFPSPKLAKELTEKALKYGISVSNQYPVSHLRQQLGMLMPTSSSMRSPLCEGDLKIEKIKKDNRYVRIKGWLYNPMYKLHSQTIRVLDDSNKVIGYAFMGQSRHELFKLHGKKALLSGYQGYLLLPKKHQSLILDGEECQLTFYF